MASFADVETEVAVLKVKDTEVYKAAVEVKLKVDASAIVEARAMVGGGDRFPGRMDRVPARRARRRSLV